MVIIENEEVLHLKLKVSDTFITLLGPVYCPVNWPGLPGGIHGVPQGQRNRGQLLRQGDGLSGNTKYMLKIKQVIEIYLPFFYFYS